MNLRRFLLKLLDQDARCPSGPEHDFRDGGWTTDEHGVGCFWCRRCGSVRQLMPASIQAPELEVITSETTLE